MLEKIQFVTLMFIGDLKAKRDERGATAVEYGLMVALIAAFIIGAVQLLGTQVDAVFRQVAGAMP
jgi:pilus assembly protein Flp/PilA